MAYHLTLTPEVLTLYPPYNLGLGCNNIPIPMHGRLIQRPCKSFNPERLIKPSYKNDIAQGAILNLLIMSRLLLRIKSLLLYLVRSARLGRKLNVSHNEGRGSNIQKQGFCKTITLSTTKTQGGSTNDSP